VGKGAKRRAQANIMERLASKDVGSASAFARPHFGREPAITRVACEGSRSATLRSYASRVRAKGLKQSQFTGLHCRSFTSFSASLSACSGPLFC
jgi:hypothetical protein